MATLHIFGDSFSRCDGTYDPVSLENENSRLLWHEYIQKELGYESRLVYAGQGWSNSEIFMTLLESLDRMEKGDLVIVGQTFMERTPFLISTPNSSKVESQEAWLNRVGGINVGVDQAYPYWRQDEYMKEFLHYMGDTFVSTQAYIANVKLKAHKGWCMYYKHRYDLLGKHLRNLGINYLWWSVADEAPNFESIKYATKGKSLDQHWSWDGQYKFGLKLLKQIKPLD